MATVEERIAFLEGRVEEHTRGVDGMRQALVSLEARMDRRFGAFEQKVDARFAALESTLILRFDSMDAKIGRLTTIVVTALAAVLAVVGGTTLLR